MVGAEPPFPYTVGFQFISTIKSDYIVDSVLQRITLLKFDVRSNLKEWCQVAAIQPYFKVRITSAPKIC